MPSSVPERRLLWLRILVFHALLLAAMFACLLWQVRPLAMQDLQLEAGGKLRWVSYSPFHHPGQTPLDETTLIAVERIAVDLTALAMISHCIRLHSIDQGLNQVPAVARKAGLTLRLSTEPGHANIGNAAQLTRALDLANVNRDVAQALIAGNKVFLRGQCEEGELRGLLRLARARSTVSISHADVREFWLRHDGFADQVDFVSAHILPFWDNDPVAIDEALAHLARIRTSVAETGWMAQALQRTESRPSPVHPVPYVREFADSANERSGDYKLIEAVDQPGKHQFDGTVGGYWRMLEVTSVTSKFPLAGPLRERATLANAIAAAVLGAAITLLFTVTAAPRHSLRLGALALVGASSGLIMLLHWEQAQLAYRNAFEWLCLGTVALLAAALAPALALWPGDGIPTAHTAWRAMRRAPLHVGAGHWLGLLRGILLFAAAVAALLLLVDPRYRDFPTLLYLAPASIFGIVTWGQGRCGRAERICAAILAICVIGRWLPEPTNPQALGWLLTGLALAVPTLLARAQQHKQG